MTLILQPKTAVTIVGANTVIENADQKVLFIGQKGSGGTATAGELDQNVQKGSTDALYDPNSMLGGMLRAALEINEVSDFDVISLDDVGDAAEGTITIVGTASEDGTLTVDIGSGTDYSFDVGVADLDSETVVAAAIAALVTADTNVPVTASSAAGVVTFTAVNAGTMGNFIGISVNTTVGGLTTTVAAMSGGATDPTLTGIFDVVGDVRYQAVVWPYFADTSVLTAFLESRFNVNNKIQDGTGFTASMDTFANNITRLDALNSLTLVDFTDKTTAEDNFKGPALMELLPIRSASFAAIRALRLTDGESISQYVISSNGALDSFGGAALASKPYFNTPLSALSLVGIGRGWTDSEIEDLADAGGSVIGNNSAGTGVITGEIHTTYKTGSAGNSDVSFKFLNYVDTASGAREYFFTNLRSRFAQSRLTTGDVTKGRDVANALVVRAYCEKLYQDLSGEDFVLLESGEEAVLFFKDNLVVTIDKAAGSATIQMITPIVTQLREILATMQIAFSTEA